MSEPGAIVRALMTLPIGPAEWIILDTSIVRGVIAAEEDAIDLEALSSVRGKHPIALAHGAPLEIIDWLPNRAPAPFLAPVRPPPATLRRHLIPHSRTPP